MKTFVFHFFNGYAEPTVMVVVAEDQRQAYLQVESHYEGRLPGDYDTECSVYEVNISKPNIAFCRDFK